MREELERNRASKIELTVVADILNTYEGLIQKHRALDAEAALTRAGKFVEHIFRALEFFRTGTAPSEIKSPAATAKLLANDTSLPESIRMLIPRIALAYPVLGLSRSGPVPRLSQRRPTPRNPSASCFIEGAERLRFAEPAVGACSVRLSYLHMATPLRGAGRRVRFIDCAVDSVARSRPPARACCVVLRPLRAGRRCSVNGIF